MCFCFFFFKQKTAYEMRISDWSSDVCSSDLIWEHHNRDYSALNEDRCADLIETIVAQGKQEFPAIVRRVTGDPDHDYEVISGARRHWTVSWLRANNYPDIR